MVSELALLYRTKPSRSVLILVLVEDGLGDGNAEVYDNTYMS